MPTDNQVAAGSIPLSAGLSGVLRIPIPGTNGLCIEFRPRGYIPKGGSTSAIFFQDISGKRHLRLDFGYNKATNTLNYHWNQQGTFDDFKVNNHTPVGANGPKLYKAAKYFRHAGRTLLVLGVAIDIVSVVQASRPLRRATEVVSAWALAWAGCKTVGGGGAAVGSLASPVGTAIGGVGGCIIGGFAGYQIGVKAGATVYDWGEAVFTPLQQVSAP